jgi:leader peptidase (prepilin peptidase)/N-methyltransferase
MLDIDTVYLSLAVVFLIGISVGSFVTLASHRLPLGEDIIFRPSRCPQCNATLKAPDLIPLLSWIRQGGRCRHCGVKISARYPLIECSLGVVFTGLAFFYGVNFNFILLALLATELAVLIVTDLEHYIIPDSIQVAVLVTGLTWRVYNGAGAEDIIPGMAAGLLIGLALHYGYLYIRKTDALGWGDVKFLCMAGAWLLPAGFVPFLFFAGVIGIATGLLWRFAGRGHIFPFGPALAFSLLINILYSLHVRN